MFGHASPIYAWHFLMRNQGIKEFDGKEFLARKTGKENKELTSLKIRFFYIFGKE